MTALDGAVRPRDLRTALRAYTSKTSYLRALLTGASRVALDGSPAGTVTAEDETAAKARLAELANPPPPPGTEAKPIPPAIEMAPRISSISNAPPAQPTDPVKPKRLSLADLREAGQRRREAAA
jgi:ProP effector